MVSRVSLAVHAIAILAFGCLASAVQAQTADAETLHATIDRLTMPFAGAQPAICTDAEFLRRVSLDLNGIPPSADAARAFLSDPSPDKRVRLIDQLFESPHYTRHLAETVDLMLMERRPNKHVSVDEWHNYLHESVKTNKPWNTLAREILVADGDKSSPRAAVRFYLDRDAEPYVLTRDVGRIFFGRDMQCAQCHDHPLIDDYHQRDYHGLLAFMLPGYQLPRTEGKTTATYYAERSGDDVAFTSVFIAGVNHTTRARLIGGEPLVEPTFLPGDEYQVAPADNVISIPKFSRRAILANDATNGTNDAFNRNIANRLWAHMLGRGLVHPVDLHHSANPPSQPDLLTELSRRFVAMNFDVKSFLREIALSSAYQRSIDLPANLELASQTAQTALPQLATQQDELKKIADAAQAAFEAAADARDKSESVFLPALAELTTARKAYAVEKIKANDADNKLKPAQANRIAKEKIAEPVLAATQAAELAAKAIPTDAELAAALAIFKTRSDALQAEVVALKNVEAPLAAALETLVKSLEAPKVAVGVSADKLSPLGDAVLALEKTAVSTRIEMIQKATALAKLKKQLSHVEQLAAYAPLHAQLVAAQTVVSEQSPKLVSLQGELKIASAALVTAQERHNQAVAAMADATVRMKSVELERASKEGSLKVIADFESSVKTAATKLGSDATLAETSAVLVERLKKTQQEFETAKTDLAAADVALKLAANELVAKQQLLQTAEATHAPLSKQVDELAIVVATANTTLTTVGPKFDESLVAITRGWSADFTVADLKPLTPEQMCWSILAVSGVYGRTEVAEEAVVEKAKPLTDAIKSDPGQMNGRRADVERATFIKLKGNLGTFSNIYGAGAGQPQSDFFATADQALFVGNGGTITGWIGPDGSNVAHRMIAEADVKKAAEDLYLSILTRFPTAAEVADVTSHLANRTDKPVAFQELIWGLITSVEFRFNH